MNFLASKAAFVAYGVGNGITEMSIKQASRPIPLREDVG
jgi:hypothetical protein